MVKIAWIKIRNETHNKEAIFEAIKTPDIWTEADALLLTWSDNAPDSKETFDSCEFTICYEDGKAFNGVYSLHHWNVQFPSLHVSIKKYIKFYSGNLKPKQWDEQEYTEFLSRYESNYSVYKELEQNYEH